MDYVAKDSTERHNLFGSTGKGEDSRKDTIPTRTAPVWIVHATVFLVVRIIPSKLPIDYTREF